MRTAIRRSGCCASCQDVVDERVEHVPGGEATVTSRGVGRCARTRGPLDAPAIASSGRPRPGCRPTCTTTMSGDSLSANRSLLRHLVPLTHRNDDNRWLDVGDVERRSVRDFDRDRVVVPADGAKRDEQQRNQQRHHHAPSANATSTTMSVTPVAAAPASLIAIRAAGPARPRGSSGQPCPPERA